MSTVGALAGILMKDFFFARSFERWKQRQSLESIYLRYRAPLLLATRELAYRLAEVVKHYPTVYLRSPVLALTPDRLLRNSVHDSYFQRYKLFSTAYRLAAMLAWIELYRQEITNLDSGRSRHSRRLENAVERVRAVLADGQLNTAVDRSDWRDGLIFREELRALGESLHESRGQARSVMGYGSFCAKVAEGNTAPNAQKWAFDRAGTLLLDLEETGRDFRHTRLKWLFVGVVDLMYLLQAQSVEPWLSKRRDAVEKDLMQVASDEP